MRFYRPDAEIIRKAANRIALVNASTYDRIVAATNYALWTPKNPDGMIEYVPDINQPKCLRVDCKKDPVTALAEGVGDCEELGAVNASLLKAMGEPSNVVSFGWLWNDNDWNGHVWVESWDDEYFYLIETTVPEVTAIPIDEKPYEVLTAYVPVDRVRGY